MLHALPQPSVRAQLEELFSPSVVALLVRLIDERADELVASRDAAAVAARKWLTLAEAGERLGCSPDAVRMRVRRGRLEARRQGRRIYVSAASVERPGRAA